MASFEKLAGNTRAGMFKQIDELGVGEKPVPKAKAKAKEPKERPTRRAGESSSDYATRYSESISKDEAEGDE